MSPIKKVAIFGASGNFGTPITAALVRSGFDVTIITREESKSTFQSGIPVIRAAYTVDELKSALQGQDAVVCAVGPAGVSAQVAMVEAAEAAGVKRFIVNDFGWGPNPRTLPDFDQIGANRRASWDRARELSEANPAFTFTGITTGNPIDWALARFPLMGFNVKEHSAIIYDSGTEKFTGTTLEGIGQATVGLLTHPNETANRFVKAQSIQTCQNDLLEAFQAATGKQWDVKYATTKELVESGRQKRKAGTSGWNLDLVVGQLFEEGEARCVIVASREDSDAKLLGMADETPGDVVAKVLRS